MDVTCERCSTEYEFDDALVSERGTTVKCTNCGHQFKVRKSAGTGVERWIVRTVDGRELEFTALRELQSAITHSRVTKDDVLSRDGARPRRLGSIAELEPFFTSFAQNARQGLSPSTTPGLGAPRARIATPPMLGGSGAAPAATEGSVAIPLPSSPGTTPAAARAARHATLEGGFTRDRPPTAEDLRRLVDMEPIVSPIAVATPRPGALVQHMPSSGFPGVIVSPTDAPPIPTARAGGGEDSGFDNTLPAPVHSPVAQGPIFAGAAADIRSREAQIPDEAPTLRRAVRSDPPGRSTEPPMASGRRPQTDSAPATPTPTDVRTSYRQDDGPYTEPRFSSLTPSRQGGRARWIAGVVLVGAVAFVALTVGRKYLVASPRPAQSTQPVASDERVAGLLSQGDRALLEGDLETAKEAIDKASALAENDSKVVVQVARFAAIRADVAWLRVRLVADDDPIAASAKRDLEAAAEKARKAAERAAEVAPLDPAVARFKVDALRLSGDRDGARKLVAGLGGSAQPDNALVLAAIELGEEKPDWRTAIERLRASATAEQNLGRARALLVFALARSGAGAEARSELDRLANLPRPHPLATPLRAFVDRVAKSDDKSDSKDKDKDKKDDRAAAKDDHGGEPKVDAPPGKSKGGGGKVGGSDRVPDDYVWPGYEAPTAAPTAAPAPDPKPAPPPAPAPAPTSDIPPGP